MAKKVNLFERENIWWIRYTINGKEVRESTGCRNKRDAKDFADQRLIMVNDPSLHKHLPIFYKDVKFEVLAGDFSKHCEGQKCWKSKKYLVARLLEHFIGMSVSKITKTELERFDKKLTAEGLKESTVNRHLNALSHMLSFGRDEGKVSAETQKVLRDYGRYDEKKFWRKHYLSPEQCISLLQACKVIGDHLYCAVLVAIFTGLRQCDILDLRWDNSNLDTREMSLIIKKTGEVIVLPITEQLHAYLVNRSGEQSVTGHLVTYNGKPINSVRKSFAHACQIAGIEGLRFHDLRHTFASFVAKKETLHVVAKLLGHTSLRCTIRYVHTCDEQMVNAVSVLDGLIKI